MILALRISVRYFLGPKAFVPKLIDFTQVLFELVSVREGRFCLRKVDIFTTQFIFTFLFCMDNT